MILSILATFILFPTPMKNNQVFDLDSMDKINKTIHTYSNIENECTTLYPIGFDRERGLAAFTTRCLDSKGQAYNALVGVDFVNEYWIRLR